jgi:hypothetical protein
MESSRKRQRMETVNQINLNTKIILDTIESFSDGYGVQIQEIIEEVKQQYPSATDQDVINAIHQGVITTGELILPFGPNSNVVAVSNLVKPYLKYASYESQSLSYYVEGLMNEFNHSVECWILISNIELMVHYRYLEVSPKLEIRLNPQVIKSWE